MRCRELHDHRQGKRPRDPNQLAAWTVAEVLSVARQDDLTEYDAAYVELALREALPLATLDDKLRRAATRVGISLVTA